MKTLFLCHIGIEFVRWMPTNYFERVLELINSESFDRYIFLDDELVHRPFELQGLGESINFGWGYEPECFDEEERKFVIQTKKSSHCYTWIPTELRDKNFVNKLGDVYICGGADFECLMDFREVLETIGIQYKELKNFIYGA